MAIKHATVVTLPDNANKQVSATAWNNSHVIEAGTIVNSHVATSAGIVEGKLSLNYPTHSNTNDPSAEQKAALNAAASPSGSNPFATLYDIPILTVGPAGPQGPAGPPGQDGESLNLAAQYARELLDCPRKVWQVFGDSPDGGNTPDSATQASIDALIADGIPAENVVWYYVQVGQAVIIILPHVAMTATITPPTLTGLQTGSLIIPNAVYAPTITVPSLLSSGMGGLISLPTCSYAPTITPPSLSGVSNGSITLPSCSYAPTVSVPSLSASAASIIVMSDAFTGTTIDTGKWTETDDTNIITQNDALFFTFPHTAGVGGNLLSVASIASGEAMMQANFDWTDPGNNESYSIFELWRDANNKIRIYTRTAGGGTYQLLIHVGGVTVYNVDSGIARGKDVKIWTDNTSVKFFYWNGSSWTQMGTTQTQSIGYGMKARLEYYDGGLNNDLTTFDNFYLCSQDSAARYPS